MQKTFIVPKLSMWIDLKMHNSSKTFFVTYIGDYTVTLLPTKGHSKVVTVHINSKATGVHSVESANMAAAYDYVVAYFKKSFFS